MTKRNEEEKKENAVAQASAVIKAAGRAKVKNVAVEGGTANIEARSGSEVEKIKVKDGLHKEDPAGRRRWTAEKIIIPLIVALIGAVGAYKGGCFSGQSADTPVASATPTVGSAAPPGSAVHK